MNARHKTQILLIIFVLIVVALQACRPAASNTQSATKQPNQTLDDIPTWTPRPQDLTARSTATELAPITQTQTVSPSVNETPSPPPTPEKILFKVTGGNLNVRRGPDTAYNYVDALYDGDIAIAVGRDRISRWLMVELPSSPGKTGWVTTETQYSTVTGDVSLLPFISVDPAIPAFIRNCTDHTILILPDDVQLLPRSAEPYNEERFYVGVHQVIDLDAPGTVKLDNIILIEGRTVDILVNGVGVKSKCE